MDDILLIEMQCKDWEHNRVNAGIIRQIKCAFPDRRVILLGEKKHIEGVEVLLKKYDVCVEKEYINFYNWRFQDRKSKNLYGELLESIMDSYPDAKEVVFLSSNGGIALACGKIAKKHPEKRFSMIFHSALEEIYRDGNTKLSRLIKDYLHQIRHSHRLHFRPMKMKKCIERCNTDNCRFLVYSPNYAVGLKGYISESIINKMIFMHHPMYDSDIKRDRDNDGLIRIGIYGQAVNQNAINIVEKYNNDYDNGTVEFNVMAKSSNDIFKCKNVKRILNDEFVSNDDLEYEISGFDYILVPYGKQQYVVTASGIFCDAISQGIPLLMLDSPYFKYYSRYRVGIVSEGVDDMAKEISELYVKRNVRNELKEKEAELKDVVYKENIEILREIL